MRSFARTPDKVQSTVERVMNALTKILFYRGKSWYISNVLVVVPTGAQYKDHDCGLLAEAISQSWLEYWSDHKSTVPASISIIDEGREDIFVGIQDLAAHVLSIRGCDIMVTLAPSAFRYFDLGTANEMMKAFMSGAKVAGVSIPEDGISEFVNRGTLGGPITAWDIKTLIEAGGFDQSAAQSMVGRENPNAGCEEIHPLVRIERKYGPCIATIQTQARAEARKLEGEDLARHMKQIETKTARQLAHAKSLGVDNLDFFSA